MIGESDRALLRVLSLPIAVSGLLLGGISSVLTLLLVPGSQAIWECLLQPFFAGHLLMHLVLLFGGSALVLTILREVTHWRGQRARFSDFAPANVSDVPTTSICGLEFLLHRLGVQRRTHVVIEDHPTAFVRGYLQPRIYLSTGLVAILNLEELEAVVLHERWHMLHRDPLRLAIVNTMTWPLRSLSSVQEMVFRHALAIEVEADHYVVERMRTSRWVAAALLRLVTCQERRSGLAFSSLIDSRIAALAGEEIAPIERLSGNERLLLTAGSLGFCVVFMSFFGITWPFC